MSEWSSFMIEFSDVMSACGICMIIRVLDMSDEWSL